MEKRKMYQHGFTLIELLIVIAIIMILSSISLFAYKKNLHSARVATVTTNLKQCITNLALTGSSEGKCTYFKNANETRKLRIYTDGNKIKMDGEVDEYGYTKLPIQQDVVLCKITQPTGELDKDRIFVICK